MEDGFVVECRICDWRESAATFADAVEVGDAHDLTHRRWFPRWWQRLFPR